MLHIISDFAVGSVSQGRGGTDTSATAMTARPRRVVLNPEGETPVMHAHINIEPTAFAIANPLNLAVPSRASANDSENRLGLACKTVLIFFVNYITEYVSLYLCSNKHHLAN